MKRLRKSKKQKGQNATKVSGVGVYHQKSLAKAAQPESGRGQPHSTTSRRQRVQQISRSVVECGCLLPLSQEGFSNESRPKVSFRDWLNELDARRHRLCPRPIMTSEQAKEFDRLLAGEDRLI